MNNVSIIGRLTADPEMHTYDHEGGKRSVANFRLAVDRPGTNEADFVNVVAFGATADALNEHVGKGRKVAVEGRIRSSEWETDAGDRRYGTEIVANRVDFLERARKAEASLDRLASQSGPTAERVIERNGL